MNQCSQYCLRQCKESQTLNGETLAVRNLLCIDPDLDLRLQSGRLHDDILSYEL